MEFKYIYPHPKNSGGGGYTYTMVGNKLSDFLSQYFCEKEIGNEKIRKYFQN